MRIFLDIKIHSDPDELDLEHNVYKAAAFEYPLRYVRCWRYSPNLALSRAVEIVKTRVINNAIVRSAREIRC